MSFYDDAKTISLMSGAAGKDGKIYNVKPTNGDGDFNFYRGTNLTATRVGPDGLIEKGNVQFARNTTWADAGDETAPTGWTDYTNNGGTYDVTSVAGQIQFVTASNQRAILISQNFATSGNYVISVDVDVVTTSCRVSEVLGSSSRATELTYFKDGAVIPYTTHVEEGSRYSLWVNKDTTDQNQVGNTTFRIGIGANANTEGNITLSKPQITYGSAPLPYVENTSTTTTKEFGVLSDEPRFDYTGGGCPKLLMEPLRVNELPYSEYFTNQTYWQLNSAGTRTNNSATSPEGVLNATSFESVGSEYNILRSAPLTLDTSTKYVFSFYAKNVDATNAHYRVHNTDSSSEVVAATSYFSQLSTTEWKRIEVSFTTDSTDTNYSVYFASGNLGGEILLWGAQVEKGSFATSYIPTHGQAATRTLDGKNSSSDIMIPADAFDLTGDFAIMMDLGDINYTHGTAASSFPLLFLLTGSSNNNLGIYFNPGSSSDGDEGVNVYFQNNGNYVFGSGSNDAGAGDSKILVTYNSTTDKLAYYINGELFDSETRALSYDASTRGYFQALSATGDGDECSFEINKIIFFDNDRSVNDSQILTGTSYTNFAEMASELSYTEYE